MFIMYHHELGNDVSVASNLNVNTVTLMASLWFPLWKRHAIYLYTDHGDNTASILDHGKILS